MAQMGRCLRLPLTMLALAGRHVAVGQVGPFGMLSPSDCHPAGPAGPYVALGPGVPSGTVSPSTSSSAILVDPGGSTLLLGEGGPKFCPDVLTDDLVLGAVVTEENTRHDGWSDPEVVGSSSVVARVGSTALPRSTDTTLVYVDECTECDILDQFETNNGMPVYYR